MAAEIDRPSWGRIPDVAPAVPTMPARERRGGRRLPQRRPATDEVPEQGTDEDDGATPDRDAPDGTQHKVDIVV